MGVFYVRLKVKFQGEDKMEKLTITEALAEVKLIGKKIEKKREFVITYLARSEYIKDPLEKDGGSISAVASAMQSIEDLQKRLIGIRRAIQKANTENTITANGITMSIADWLTWRREVAPTTEHIYREIREKLNAMRNDAQRQGRGVVPSGTTDAKPNDIVVNLSEKELQGNIENLETILGQLDGQLSLKNATIVIEI
jgi:hypothetical protein